MEKHTEREIIKFSQYLTVSDKVLIFKKTFRFLLNTLAKSESKKLIRGMCNYTNCSNDCQNRYFCGEKLHMLYAHCKKFPIMATTSVNNVEFQCEIIPKKEVTFVESKITMHILKNLAKLLHPNFQSRIFTEYFLCHTYHVKIRNELPFEFQIGRCNFKCTTGQLCKRQTRQSDFFCRFPNHRLFAIYNKLPVNQAPHNSNFKVIENSRQIEKKMEDIGEEEMLTFENCSYDNCEYKGVYPDINFAEMKFCKRHVGLDPIESYSTEGPLILETVKIIQMTDNPIQRLNLANSIQFGCF